MPYDSYPEAQHVRDYARAMGLIPQTASAVGVWCTSAAASGAAEWERRTGYVPFLAAQDSDRYFDPPFDTRFLPFDGGLAALTTLKTGVAADGSGGTTLTPGLSFRLLPLNAPAQGKPYEAIEVLSQGYDNASPWSYGFAFNGIGSGGLGPYGRAGSVKITGKWGAQTALSADVWRAILALGLLTTLPELSFLLTGGLLEWEEAGVSEKYGPTPLKGLSDLLTRQVEAVLPLYTRPRLYL